MRRPLLAVFVLFAATTGIGAFAHFYPVPVANVAAAIAYKTPQEQNDLYVRFVLEAYDIIQVNYWQKAPDAQMASLFQLSLDKAGSTSTPAVSDRPGIAKQLDSAFNSLTGDTQKRQLATAILQVALYNLAPNGRSELLTAQDQKAVQNTVANINPSSNLYNELGVAASSSEAQIREAYTQKKQALEASSSPAAAAALQRASYVNDVLTNSTDKARYDQNKAEPTVFPHVFGSTIYLNVARMSPQTAGDFIAALNNASTTPLSSMVIDLRNNIGGSLEQVPNMIGIFMGLNQYEFDIFHQSDFQPIRSPIARDPDLDRYKEIAILTNDQTQSSAEVMTSALKRFHMAYSVGTNTRGWGSVENTFTLTTQIDPSTQYALLLVIGLTLRPDNQPIESSGVDVDVSIRDKNWQSELSQYFHSQSLIAAIEKTVTLDPLK